MLAYLILEHKSPRQLARLLDALQHPEVAFFVHVDAKIPDGQFRYMTRHLDNVHFLGDSDRVVVDWGGWSMVEAELRLLRVALDAGADAMVLLSGADYPVWCNERIVRHFLDSDQSFLEHFTMPSEYWDGGGLNRIHQYWAQQDPPAIRSRLWTRTIGRLWRPLWRRVIQRILNLLFKLGYELKIRRRYIQGVTPYIGSQWWSLTRKHAEGIFEFIRSRPDILQFYRRSHIPDEGFIQTLVMNSDDAEAVINNNYRHVMWDGKFNPRTLELDDLDSIIRSGCAFSRKMTMMWLKDPQNGRLMSSLSLMNALDDLREDERRSIETSDHALPIVFAQQYEGVQNA